MSKVAKSFICRGFLNPVTSAGRTSVDIGATTVPRSTQPSTLRGMAKWVSAYGLSNNNNGEVDVGGSCQFSVDSQPESIGLVWGFNGHPVLSLHSSNEPGELSQWLWSVVMIAP